MKIEAGASPQRDATIRAVRTFIQGLVTAILIAAGITLATALQGMSTEQLLDKSAWIGVGVLVLQAGVTAGASWLQRRLEGVKE